MLTPTDIWVLAGLITLDDDAWTQSELAGRLGVSQAAVHRALVKLARAGLCGANERSVRARAVQEFLVHGLRYMMPAELGPPARGVPTAHGAPVMAGAVVAESPYVWPLEDGGGFGTSLTPVHASVPRAALADARLYDLMALVDVLRVGRARERKVAEERLAELLGLA